MIDLYHWEPNAHQGKRIIALNEKGIGFVSPYVDLLAFEQVSPAYLAVNPEGIVPVMVRDGLLLRESTAICEYIDAAFPGPAAALVARDSRPPGAIRQTFALSRMRFAERAQKVRQLLGLAD